MKPGSMLPAWPCWVLGMGVALSPLTVLGQTNLPDLNSWALTGQETLRSAYLFEITGWGAGVVTSPGAPAAVNFGQVVSSPKPLPDDTMFREGQGWVVPGYADLTVLTDNIQLTANTVGVACGEKHTLLLKRDGTVRAVGSPQSQQVAVPVGLSNVVAIAAGTDHSLALTADARVVAWGWNNAGQLCVPSDLTGVRAIAAGRNYSLALLTNGTVRAWGGIDQNLECTDEDDDKFEGGEMKPPGDIRRVGRNPVVAIAAGVRHALALRADGSVVGWGEGCEGSACEPPAGFEPFTVIGAGNGFSVGLRRDGTVRAWGDNRYRKLEVPAHLNRVVALACGNYHTLALRDDGSVVAWGNDAVGQATVPSGTGRVVAIAAGGFHSEILEHDGPLMMAPRIQAGRFGCEMILPAGQRYRLQVSGDLEQWTTVTVDTAFPTRMRWESAVRPGAVFYRVQPVWPGEVDYLPGFLPRPPY